MPLYDVRCLACGGQDEVSLRLAAAVPPCEHCGGERERMISLPRVARVAGRSGLITDMRQVTAECGTRWRDAGTRGTPGGSGAVGYYHARAAR